MTLYETLATIGINIILGVIMADLVTRPGYGALLTAHPRKIAVFSTFTIFIGFLCNSYPDENADWANWSNEMKRLGTQAFPVKAELNRFFPAIGAHCIVAGILASRGLQRMLSTPFLVDLGGYSWPLYLTHATILRTFLATALFAFPGEVPTTYKTDMTMRKAVRGTVSVLAYYFIVLKFAKLWSKRVDPWCGRLLVRMEERLLVSRFIGKPRVLP
jgi:hypothetical protein